MKQSLQQSKSKKYTWSSLLFLVLLAVTFFWIFRTFSISDLLQALEGIRWGFLLVGIGLILLYILWEGLSLRVILRNIGHPTKYISSFVYAAIDLYYSGITPSASGGQPVMLYYMSKDKVPLAKSGIATLFNLIAYKAVLLIAGAVTLVFKSGWIAEHGRWWWWMLIAIGFVVNSIMLLLCVLSVFSSSLVKKLGSKGICLLGRLHWIKQPEQRIQSLERQLEDYAAAAKVLRENRTLFWKVLFCNFMQRLSMFSVTYCVYLSFGLPGLSYGDLLATQVICALAVDTLPLPGGVGMAEFMTQELYGGIYPESIQTPAMLLTRGINFYFCMVVCAITSLIFHFQFWFHKLPEEDS